MSFGLEQLSRDLFQLLIGMNKGVQNLTNKPRQTGNVTANELLISSLAQTDALAKPLIEKGLITREEFIQKISEERATYQKLLNPPTQ
jgi:hypothetical protein